MDDTLSKELLSNRTVILEDKITVDSSKKLADQLLLLQVKDGKLPIHLLINSGGGHNTGALLLHDLILNVLTAPVHALVIGKCMSAATFVILATPFRRSVPHARFVIHSGTMSNISLKMDDMTPKQMELLGKDINRSAEQIAKFYCDHLKLSKKKVRELIARGDQENNNELYAEEALEIGLITEIVSGKADVFPPCN